MAKITYHLVYVLVFGQMNGTVELPFSWWITLRVTSYTRLRARDQYTSSTLIGGKGGAGPSSLHTTLEGPTEYIKWMQDECKVYMDSYMASNGTCFMVTWTIFKSHLLEVGLTQNQETMTFWTLIIVGLSYFIMRDDSTWIEIHWNSIWLRTRHVWLHTTLEDPYVRGVLGQLWDTFFWALTISWSRLLAPCVWSGPSQPLLNWCDSKTSQYHIDTKVNLHVQMI